jgi:hypothetical protein
MLTGILTHAAIDWIIAVIPNLKAKAHKKNLPPISLIFTDCFLKIRVCPCNPSNPCTKNT